MSAEFEIQSWFYSSLAPLPSNSPLHPKGARPLPLPDWGPLVLDTVGE
jgi:hypothetical protein